MQLQGKNYVGNDKSALGSDTFYGVKATTGENLEPPFREAVEDEVNAAVEKAKKAFRIYKNKSGREKADFLDAIADELLGLGNQLIKRASVETALPEGRITGERGRTMGQ